ncbi:MAG: S24 family peptidase, partial [Lachnospiraceae bacterium]|nr:S24 family peptidase [Lachnospiraceae bacterium]
CEPNYIFQDMVKIKTQNNDVTLAEYKHIKKYRFISEHSPDGAKMVDTVLNREYSIAAQLKEQSEYIQNAEKPINNDTNNNIDMRLINYYYRVASAGTGQIIFDMPPTKRIEIPNIPEYRKIDYAIGVNGTSMEPTYHDGDMLLVEMTEEIEIGDIGIFRVDNESYVKKLGRTELISLNPNAENIPLNETARCMGKVIDKLPNDKNQ